ncbi:MAG: peptide chain release factor aRF-1 [Candidatus Micrarchaeota archaeon]|nr:peptide chain release factor aRF-1 [Candidatus Micrarchaeota archaeon]
MKNEYSLMKEVKQLRAIRGQGTELITVYIAADYPVFETMGKLREELNQSSNIKSKQTRTNVTAAIEKILSYLKLFRQTPKNGLAIYAGNISDIPGRESIELFSIEPPLPLKVNMYRCDSDFMLEPIEDMIEAKDTYCLVVMDGRDATVATLKGPQIRIIRRLHSMAHAKVRKGGQSARRFERLREEGIEDFHKRIGEAVNVLYAQMDFKLKGLLVGGPGPAKEGFAKSETLNYQVKTLGVFNTGYTDEFGLHELVEQAKEVLAEQEASKERVIIERFMHEVARGGLAVYGFGDTMKATASKKADRLIINKELDLIEEIRKNNSSNKMLAIVFRRIGKLEHPLYVEDLTPEIASPAGMKETIEEINAMSSASVTENNILYKRLVAMVPALMEKKDAIEEIIKKADEGGVAIDFVSGESSFGKQFLMGFSGLGAILRYK